ncbi:P2Y purinoceptor 1-like isoform X1 [Lethenteron reissneri]|uniref:P2Y purinoceptor 1-like isoform X1 n=2 Tax=Lethenteron reissneri TaxID=7753 RepID=UPI002AB6BEDA|nr:P2Y purinoceptor 1-like isoform X1 [Lethenteron reissneri]
MVVAVCQRIFRAPSAYPERQKMHPSDVSESKRMIMNDSASAENKCLYNEDILSNIMPPVLLLEFVFGLMGNLFTIWITWWHIKVWSGFTVYLFNLALADLLFVVQLPLRIAYHLRVNDWILGEFSCDLMITLFYTNMYGSIYFLTCISVERWQAIDRPLHSLARKSPGRATIISLAMWALAIIPQIGMPLIFDLIHDSSNKTNCLSFNQEGVMLGFGIWNTVEVIIGFLIPFIIIIFVQIKITHKLLCPSMNPGLEQMRKRASRLMIIILVIFATCFVPIHIFRVFLVAAKLYLPKNCGLNQLAFEGVYWSLLLSSCNCFMDPLILFASGNRFRRAAALAVSACVGRTRGAAKGRTTSSTINMHSLEAKENESGHQGVPGC